MPEKEQKLIVPTGDYLFKIPSTVNLTMPVSVEPMEEELNVAKLPAKSKGVDQVINLVSFFWKALGLALLMLAAALALYWIVARPDYRQSLNTVVMKLAGPITQPPDMRRYVIARQAILAQYPGGFGERYALDQGYVVTFLGETHQLNNGKVWMRVRAQYGSPAQPFKVDGWMQADNLSE